MPEKVVTTRIGGDGRAARPTGSVADRSPSTSKKRKREVSEKANGGKKESSNPPQPSSAAELRQYILTPPSTDSKPAATTNAEQKHGTDQTFPWNHPRQGQQAQAKPPYLKAENANHKSPAQALWAKRKTLPIWNYSITIRQSFRKKDILLLVGETGSGKSTQIPQMLMSEPWFKEHTTKPAKGGKKVGGCIAITEPRRVAAISLARRVAEEMGTPLGGRGKVGYSVRFDHCAGEGTRVKYLTEGMLLQEMLRDPWLREYSAVVVDEVHERGANVDLVLGFLKRMVVGDEGLEERGGRRLKVCVMSATAEVERLVDFFGEKPGKKIPGAKEGKEGVSEAKGADEKTDEVDGNNRKEESEWEGIITSDDEEKPQKPAKGSPEHAKPNRHVLTNGDTAGPRHGNLTNGDGNLTNSDVVNNGNIKHEEVSLNGDQPPEYPPNLDVCYIAGRQYPVSIFYTDEAVEDFVDASLRTIFQLHHSEPMPGDILVFLTGQETVENLEELVNEYAQKLSNDVPKMLVLPLFAALPQSAQQRVFQPAPRGTRKVILSTNIAETSLTLSGVRYVIDCGKAKTKHFRSRIGLESLLVKPISKSSAIQRKGRAGREAEGKCYRLYTESTYLDLERNPTPEILRSDLSQAILTMKARGVEDITTFPFLSPPSRNSLAKALLLLHQLDALCPTGTITDIGKRMAHLPLSGPLSRALIAASQAHLDCLDETIDITSCLSVENIFLAVSTEEKREAAAAARSDLLRREGDHLTLLATIRAYAAENGDRKGWCDRRFVSHRAMRSVLDVRKQLRSNFRLPATRPGEHEPSTLISSEKTERILKAFMAGFKMNTARLMPDGRYRTLAAGNQYVSIHPASVLMGRKVECIMYDEFVFTNKAYARGVSAVQMDWVGEAFDAGGDDAEGDGVVKKERV